MSSLDVPAATIGHTIASLPTTKSTTTGTSLMPIAFSIVASTSAALSQRSPTQPMASASLTKSGRDGEVRGPVLGPPKVGVGVARPVEQRLPLPHHAERTVVDDGHLDRDAFN